MQQWHQLEPSVALRQQGVSVERGLDAAEVALRHIQYGRNELVERDRKSPWRIIWEQLTGTMVVILTVAAAISAALGYYEDTIVILAIIALNAISACWTPEILRCGAQS